MKYLKLFEKDIFEEEWDLEEEPSENNDYCIVKKMGDDQIYFTKRVKVPYDRKYGGKQFYEIKYYVMEKDHKGKYVFTKRYTLDNNSIILLTLKEIHSILHDKLNICYIGIINQVIPVKLSFICDLLGLDKDYINFKRRW